MKLTDGDAGGPWPGGTNWDVSADGMALCTFTAAMLTNGRQCSEFYFVQLNCRTWCSKWVMLIAVNVTVAKLVGEFTTLCGNRRVITVFTTLGCIASQLNPIHVLRRNFFEIPFNILTWRRRRGAAVDRSRRTRKQQSESPILRAVIKQRVRE